MPTNIQIAPRGRALLLVDFQRDFIEATGRMPVARSQVWPVLDAARREVIEARKAGDPVVAIGNEFRPQDLLMNMLRRNAGISGSDGARWTERLPVEDATYFPKWAGSAFVNPALDPWLRARSVQTIVLAGLFARACITATATAALARGYDVCIPADAVACASDRSRDRSLERLEAKGITVVRDPHLARQLDAWPPRASALTR